MAIHWRPDAVRLRYFIPSWGFLRPCSVNPGNFSTRSAGEDPALAADLFLTLVLSASLIAVYGLVQTWDGLPTWDQMWVNQSGYAALSVGTVTRAFGTFSSSAEYASFLGIAIVTAVAFALDRRPYLLPAVPLLAVALFYESGRAIVVTTAVAVVVVLAARTGSMQRATVTLIVLLTGVVLALVLARGALQSASYSSNSLVSHQVGGLIHPLNQRQSTLHAHLGLLEGGLKHGALDPIGYGIASTTLAGSKLGGTPQAATTEVDLSNEFVATGTFGGLAYLAILVLVLIAALRNAVERRDAVSLSILGMLVAIFGQWLNGGYYAVASIVWFSIGFLIAAERKRVLTVAGGEPDSSATFAGPEVLVLTPDFPPGIGGIQTLVWRLATGFTSFRPRVVTIAADGGRTFDLQQPFEVVRVPAAAGHRFAVGTLNALGLLAGPATTAERDLERAHRHRTGGRHAWAGAAPPGRPAHPRAGATKTRGSRSQHPESSRRNRGRQPLQPGAGGAPRRSPRPHPRGPSRSGLRYDTARAAVRQHFDRRGRAPRRAVQGARHAVASAGSRAGTRARRQPAHRGRRPAQARARASVARTRRRVGDDVPRCARQRPAGRDSRRGVRLRNAEPDRVGRGRGGFGIAFVEAGALGLPVVAGNVGGALDAVVDGETGLLVDPRSPEAIARALVELLQDRERARRLGRAGWEHARSHSWTRAAAGVEAVLAEVTTR